MTSLRGAATLISILFACACQPMVFPRTAEIAQPKSVSLQGGVQLLSLEPQSVVELSGAGKSATVGFFPDWDLELHVGLGRCETGLVLVDFGGMAELRCMALRRPISIAFSGAAGAAASSGIGFAPAARLGIDVSHRFGSFEPLIDVYVTSAAQQHFIQTGIANDPVVGPVGDTMGRHEIRLTIPIGFAILFPDKAHLPLNPTLRSLIFGVEPWFVLASLKNIQFDPIVSSYQTDRFGVGFTMSLAFR